jgi:hypothetical protein
VEQFRRERGDAEIVAAEADPDVGRAEFVVHVVVVPERLDVGAEIVRQSG